MPRSSPYLHLHARGAHAVLPVTTWACPSCIWSRGPMDKASAFGAGDCRFKSCRDHALLLHTHCQPGTRRNCKLDGAESATQIYHGQRDRSRADDSALGRGPSTSASLQAVTWDQLLTAEQYRRAGPRRGALMRALQCAAHLECLAAARTRPGPAEVSACPACVLATPSGTLPWMTPSGASRAPQASECGELLDPAGASCWISAQH